jgi:hypothetical protein
VISKFSPFSLQQLDSVLLFASLAILVSPIGCVDELLLEANFASQLVPLLASNYHEMTPLGQDMGMCSPGVLYEV